MAGLGLKGDWPIRLEEESAYHQQTKGETKIIKQLSCLRKYPRGFFLLCLLQLMVVGCHYREEAGLPVPEGKIIFDRIAVVPFVQIAPEESIVGISRCPLCGMTVNAAVSPGNAEKVVEGLFLDQLNKKIPKYKIIAEERVAGVYRWISTDSLRKPLRQVLREVGNELGADGVVAGYVYRYRERKGVSYTVEQPASVAVEIHLLRVSDGALVWRGYFDKTQSSLMENLLQFASFYRRKGKWVTAEELAIEGLEQMIKTFPSLP